MKQIITLLLFLFALIGADVQAQDLMTRKEKRAIIKAIRKGEATTKRKDYIIYVDKIREVEVVREVPTFVDKIKEVLRDTCLKSRQEVRFDFKHAKEENDKAIRLAKIETEGRVRLMRLEVEQVKSENASLKDSLVYLAKLRKVEGNTAQNIAKEERKSEVAESRSKAKISRGGFKWWLWFLLALVIAGFVVAKFLPKKFL